MNRDEVARAIRAERRRTLALLGPLEPERYDTPTSLPGWRIREVAAHLVTTDRAGVTGTILPHVLRSAAAVEAWNDRQVRRWADRPVPDLLLALDRWGRRLARLVRAVPSALYRLRVPTMWGRGPLLMVPASRPFDEWVHRQDMRRALGLPDEDVDLVPAAEFLLRAIGLGNLAAVDPSVGPVAVSLTGVPILAWGYDPGSGNHGPEIAATAAATIACPGPAFVMAAAGRDSFEALEASGHLVIEGDGPAGRAFLAAVRVV